MPERKVQRPLSLLSDAQWQEKRKRGYKLKHRGVALNKSRLFYTLSVIRNRLSRVSILRYIQKSSGHSPGQPARCTSTWTGVVDQKTSKGPSQLLPILSKYLKLRKMVPKTVTYLYVTNTSIWLELEKT